MRINSVQEMSSAARALLECCTKDPLPSGGALLLTLSGELGAGKTTFVQALAQELGIIDRITSPTFVIQKEYTINSGKIGAKSKDAPFTRLVHIDAYRLNFLADLELLGWGDLLRNSETLIALEWPERVEGIASHNRRIDLTFSHVEEGTRNILFDGREHVCR